MDKFYYYSKKLKQFSRQLRNNPTLSETVLWNEVLKGRKLGYQFHRQRPILNYIGDFFCKELRLVIELDGVTHQEESVKVKDRIKQDTLESLQYTVIRFKDEEVVGSLDDVREKIKKWISQYEKAHPEILQKKDRRKRS